MSISNENITHIIAEIYFPAEKIRPRLNVAIKPVFQPAEDQTLADSILKPVSLAAF
jgi:hypothetical protein